MLLRLRDGAPPRRPKRQTNGDVTGDGDQYGHPYRGRLSCSRQRPQVYEHVGAYGQVTLQPARVDDERFHRVEREDSQQQCKVDERQALEEKQRGRLDAFLPEDDESEAVSYDANNDECSDEDRVDDE